MKSIKPGTERIRLKAGFVGFLGFLARAPLFRALGNRLVLSNSQLGKLSIEPIKPPVEVAEVDGADRFYATNSPAPSYHKFGNTPDISPISTKKDPAVSAKFYELA